MSLRQLSQQTAGVGDRLADASFWILVWVAPGWFIPSWRLDDQPSDKLKVGGFGRLVFFVWNHKAALGLQTREDAFLESAGDGFDRLQVVAVVRWELGIIR